MTDGEISYDGYSAAELREAPQAIDRERFPRNFHNLQAALRARGLRDTAIRWGDMTADRPRETVDASEPPVAPEVVEFFQRLRQLTPRTPVTYALIAINVAVFIAMAIAGAGILVPDGRVHVEWGSNLVPVTVGGEWWRLATSMFLHFGLIHVLLNMWVLYANGLVTERLLGSTRFLILYLFAGLAGSLAGAAWHPAVNSAGASGAIFGVLGGMVAFLLVKRYRVPREVIRAQGRSIAAFVFYNVVFGLSHEGIDNAAHFGGFAGGLLIGLALARPVEAEARAEPQTLRVTGIGIAAALVLLAMADAALYMRERQSPEERYAAGTVWFDYGEPRVLVVYNDMVEQAKGHSFL